MAGWRWRRLRAAWMENWRLETYGGKQVGEKDRIAAMSHQIQGDRQLEISIQVQLVTQVSSTLGKFCKYFIIYGKDRL